MRVGTTPSTLKLLTLSLVVVGACCSPLPAQSSGAADKVQLSGTYTTTGVNRDGSTYNGTLEIEQVATHRLYMRWQDEDSSYQGVAARVGTSLYAVWGSAEAQCFVVFYTIQPDGVLDGFWFGANDRNLDRGQEKAVPMGDTKAGNILTAYTVEGTAPDGSKYSRELKVSHLDGNYYRFRWSGDVSLEGIGQLDEDRIQIIASFAGHEGQCGRSEIDRDENGVLHGTWTMNDGNFSVGTETAVPVR